MPDNTNPGMGIGPIGTAAIGAGSGIVSNIMDIAFGKMRQRQALEGQKKSQEIATAAQLDMWNKTNFEAQKEHIKNAGLSTGLIYGMGGAGGQTTGSTAGPVPGGQGGGGMDIAGAAQLALIQAQAEKLKAETRNIETETGIKQANKIVADVLADQANMDFWDYYGNLEEWDSQGNVTYYENPQRIARKQEKMAQLRANEGNAKQILDNYTSGRLKQMSQAELDNELKKIGIADGTIKKLELENALTEMEKKLMEQLGMGRDAKGWIDMGQKLIMSLLMKGMGGK